MKQILGYTDRLTVCPGDQIAFKISAEDGAAYRAQLVRLINGDTHSKAANFREIEISSHINGSYKARRQPIALGSCVVVSNTRPLIGLDSFTVALTFMPTTPKHGRQHLISLWDQRVESGWSLQIDDGGQLTFNAAGSSGRTSMVNSGQALASHQWYHAAARVSWLERTVTLDCIPLASRVLDKLPVGARRVAEVHVQPSGVAAPLLIAAGFGGFTSTGRCISVENFNGRIESPVIYKGLLTDPELGAVLGGARPASLSPRLLGDWDFSREIGSTVIKDRTGNGLSGRTHNLPLRGVKGSRWSGSEVSFRHAPSEYGAIHFHTDDLYDCGWETDIIYRVPEALRSGVYALRLRLMDEAARNIEEGHEEYLPFFVAPPRGKATSDLAFLVPTYTYLAYGNVRAWHLHRKASGLSPEEYSARNWIGPGSSEYCAVLSEHPELGSSTYDHHGDGSPVHTSSWLRPLLNVRPKSVLWSFCADLLLIDWLEAKGIAYDIITDELVQTEAASLLKNYRVVMTGNHPEYQTTEQLDAIEAYISHGGRLMYMGGNGFYWRCATSASALGAVEVRRGRIGTSIWQSDVGEDYLSLSGELGAIWREIGRPPQRLVGVGFIAEGHDDSYYRVLAGARDTRAGFLLNGVTQEIVGDFGIFGSAVGQEIDKTSSIRGTPPHAIVVARSENHKPTMVHVIEEMDPVNPNLLDYQPQTCAEVVFFETPQGGAVFSVGSMAWCGSLSHNEYENSVSRITENVVKRFLDPLPFAMPSTPRGVHADERGVSS